MIAPSAELSQVERALLEALCEPGTRWHRLPDLAVTIEFPERIARSGLARLRRRGFATPRARLGPGAHHWSVTTLGEQAHRELDEEEAA